MKLTLLNAACNSPFIIVQRQQLFKETLRIMKLTAFMLLIMCLQVTAKVASQTLTYSGNNIPLEKLFSEIERQTGLLVVCNNNLIKNARPVSVHARNTPLNEVLTQVLRNGSLTYDIAGKSIVISEKKSTTAPVSPATMTDGFIPITGMVRSAAGQPLSGASVKIKGSTNGTSTNADGQFTLNVSAGQMLIISYTGFKEKTVTVGEDKIITVILELLDTKLDEVQVIAYGTTTKRLNTGSVVSVKAEDIARHPVSNPLAALAGMVPGMIVTQTSGAPGAAINIQIRGQNSIAQGSAPLFLVDGVPYPNTYLGSGNLEMGNGGQSPFSNINPQDIQSIEVLKDADATAIYGSRGANGVVLITTKKGSSRTTKADMSFYTGSGQVTRRLKLLNTQQYVAMRKEALANDGRAVTALTAPDLVLWDTTRYTDWQDYFIGGTAGFTNANVSVSGGNNNTQFLLSANYNRQKSVFPGNFAESRGSAHFNVNHASTNKKFQLGFSGSYSTDKNRLPSDLTGNIILAPNNPALWDQNGKLVWSENGGNFTNPLAALVSSSTAETDNFLTNLNLDYELIPGLNLKVTAGYNYIQFNEKYLHPRASLDPNTSTLVSSSSFENTTAKSWIAEPQIQYIKSIDRSKLEFLVGATIQHDNKSLYSIDATDFPGDDVLEATVFAKSVKTITSIIEYRYEALFGRINYNFDNKYLLNLTARRDGSSRFGPDKKVANFGAIGAGWIFTEESWLKKNDAVLSFGKLRGSYGITGNDQIGNYRYLDNYGATTVAYQGQVGYIPSRIYNDDYTWERNKKLEAGLELGFLNNRVLLTTNWFRNRSDNQLIDYKLPNQTGFSSILRNFGALVENTGWEFDLKTDNIKRKDFAWRTSFNLTLARNKLLEFPGLETSSYANTLVIGQPLNIEKLVHYTGVDAATGLHTFIGSWPADATSIRNLTPKFYGGLSNAINYKAFELSFLFQFVKQNGPNYLRFFGLYPPGFTSNQPTEILERWQKAGDVTSVQKLTSTGTSAYSAYDTYAIYSDACITDASFIRLKNVSLAYTLPQKLIKPIGLKSVRLYFQAQNLFTITDYKGLDPESNLFSLPVLRMGTLGLQLNF